jgi:hypothetical protein
MSCAIRKVYAAFPTTPMPVLYTSITFISPIQILFPSNQWRGKPFWPDSVLRFSHVPFHDVALSTQPCSNFLTSALKFSTSCQQSRGLLSFSLKHRTTSALAPSTLSGMSRRLLRPSSLWRRSSISLATVKLVCLEEESSSFEAAASFSCAV